MNDIERRLRALGERAAEGFSGPSELTGSMSRRIRRRRVAVVGVASLVTLAVVAGSTLAFTSAFRNEPLPPATESPLLIEYERRDVTSGHEQRLKITTDGLATLHTQVRRSEGRVEYQVRSSQFARLKDEIDEIGWSSLKDSYELDDRVSSLGRITHVVTHSDVAVEINAAAIPPELASLVELLEQILNRAPSADHVLGCGPPVDFEPTYLPERWIKPLQPGEGGGGEFQGVVGHYGNDARAGTTAKARDGFATLIAAERPYAQSNIERIRVLDERATLGDIHEGYSVEFTYSGCDYFLIAFGITRDELRRFAQGLRVPGTGRSEHAEEEDFAAIWPEDTLGEAEDGCGPTRVKEWRRDPVDAAVEFGRQMLGWEPSAIVRREEGRRVDVTLRRGTTDEGAKAEGPAVMVYMKEVLDDCWSVGSVSRLPDRRPTGISISIRNRDVEVGFDDLGAESIYFEMGHGFQTMTADGELADGRITWILRYKPDQTGHFLFLFKDENGEVFSASGGPLPAGDFVAG